MLAAALRDGAARIECCGAEPCTQRIPGFKQWLLPDGSESEVCPHRLVTADTARVMSLHGHYMRGHLPAPGALLDQSAWLISAFEILSDGRR